MPATAHENGCDDSRGHGSGWSRSCARDGGVDGTRLCKLPSEKGGVDGWLTVRVSEDDRVCKGAPWLRWQQVCQRRRCAVGDRQCIAIDHTKNTVGKPHMDS